MKLTTFTTRSSHPYLKFSSNRPASELSRSQRKTVWVAQPVSFDEFIAEEWQHQETQTRKRQHTSKCHFFALSSYFAFSLSGPDIPHSVNTFVLHSLIFNAPAWLSA